jgi:hypothetical protein
MVRPPIYTWSSVILGEGATRLLVSFYQQVHCKLGIGIPTCLTADDRELLRTGPMSRARGSSD